MEHKFCLLCKNSDLILINNYTQFYLVKCRNCGFIFSKKVPSETEISSFYNNYPFQNSVNEITVKRYNSLLDFFEKYRKTNNILDVGCGEGFFLEEAIKRGWKAYGTEYAEQYIDSCKEKGINMRSGKLDANNYPNGFFDVILSIEVLEHINTPLFEVNQFNTLLRKGGLVYSTTPNFNSISRKILGNRWNVITYPEHLSYFTSSSIKMLFRDSGFQVKKIKTTGISLDRLKNSMKSDKINSIQTTDARVRSTMEINPILRFAKAVVNSILSVMRIGDTLKVYAEKL